jgi:hypothetical protein
MIVHLDWFGCDPRHSHETKIHQMLEKLGGIRPITRASLRIEEGLEGAPPFHLILMLSMPGPDVLVHSNGQTFEEALLKLEALARKNFEARAIKSKQADRAVRGVKAMHRG